MASTSMPSFIVELWNSGDYSDFVLVCEGQRINAHKAIVCTQSPVLAACLRSGLKETQENAVDVNFALSVCQQMVRFLYTGDYEVPLAEQIEIPPQSSGSQPLSVDGGDGAPKDANTNTTLPQDSSSPNQDSAAKDNYLPSLYFHVQMNSIADYYEIRALSKSSRTRIHDHFISKWSARDFTEVVKKASEFTGDKQFFKMIGSLAATHIEELGKSADFVALVLPDSMTAEIISVCGQRLQKAKEDNMGLEAQLQAARNELKTAKIKIKALETELQTTKAPNTRPNNSEESTQRTSRTSVFGSNTGFSPNQVFGSSTSFGATPRPSAWGQSRMILAG
ncbi:hypothetical protein F4810DRAFT_706982 [Camillea tinctor]|nr:hypothetical protein F4810DRAFT_706982 [Camillea tinctor]